MFKVKKSGKKIRNCKTISSAVKALKSGLHSKTKSVAHAISITIQRVPDGAKVSTHRRRKKRAKKSA